MNSSNLNCFLRATGFLALVCLPASISLGALMGPSFDPSNQLSADSIFDFQTFGGSEAPAANQTMAGMKVTVYSTTGTSSAIWDASGTPGEASPPNGGWSLSQAGDTYSPTMNDAVKWTLRSKPGTGPTITRVVIEAWRGDVVFDVLPDLNNANDTPNSQQGSQIALGGGNFAGDVSATYRRAISVGGNAARPDLYGVLDLAFSGAAFGSDTTLEFWTDTDNGFSVVPEPSSGLLCLSAVGLAFLRRRRS